MTPEKQRIAIAEVAGAKWQRFESGAIWITFKDGLRGFTPCSRPKDVSDIIISQSVPNYPADLNAMHEAEKVLMEKGLWYKYCDELYNRFKGEGDCHTFMHATASQRAEAFLQTLNLWEAE